MDLKDIQPQCAVGLRKKGKPIFYSCTILSAEQNRIVVSIPAISQNALEPNNKVELLLLPAPGKEVHEICSGTVTDVFSDSMQIIVTSRKKHMEKRSSFRVTCELRLKYMEEKGIEEVWHTTYSINISPGGIKMYSPRFHQEDDILIFQFNIPDGFTSRYLLVRGRVLGVKRVTDFTTKFDNKNQSYRKFIIQVRFEGLSPRDRMDMIRYIYTVNADLS
ncbi:MAG: PilZ domain-containing protein [Bacillota bacterium]